MTLSNTCWCHWWNHWGGQPYSATALFSISSEICPTSLADGIFSSQPESCHSNEGSPPLGIPSGSRPGCEIDRHFHSFNTFRRARSPRKLNEAILCCGLVIVTAKGLRLRIFIQLPFQTKLKPSFWFQPWKRQLLSQHLQLWTDLSVALTASVRFSGLFGFLYCRSSGWCHSLVSPRSCVPNFLRLRFLEFQTIFRSHTFLALIFVSYFWIVSKSQSFQTLLFERKFPPTWTNIIFFVRLHLVCHPHESLTFLRLLSKPAIPLLWICYWVTMLGVEWSLEKFS